jgi:sec-independent protein translocase protein TatB
MANLGMADSLILMVMALVVFGPRRLPQIGRQIGKLMYEFRKASNDFKFQMEEELRSAEEVDRRKKEEERRLKPELAAPSQSVDAPLPTDAVSPVTIGVSADATPAVIKDEANSDKSGATEQATDNG